MQIKSLDLCHYALHELNTLLSIKYPNKFLHKNRLHVQKNNALVTLECFLFI